MVKVVKAPTNPDVLAWARRSACVSVEEAAHTVSVKPERILEWESGQDQPPLGKLRLLASKYKRPLAVLLLREPPTDFMPLRDFRRIDDAEKAMSPKVALEIRTAHERRELALEMAHELGDTPVSFTFTLHTGDNVETAGAKLRDYFSITPEQQKKWAKQNKVFENWRSRIEAKGVLVFVMGGSHGPRVRDVRGFAIADKLFPVAAVNGKDRTNGRTFSLLHECVHLALGQDVVENQIHSYRHLPAADRIVEKFCNAVAATALMPKDEVAEIANSLKKQKGSEWSDAELNLAADRLGVSREAFLLRATSLGFASTRFYASKRAQFQKEYEKLDEPSGDSVPIAPYKTMINRYGRTFARMVLNSYHDRRITMNDAAAFLNVQAKHIDFIARQTMQRV